MTSSTPPIRPSDMQRAVAWTLLCWAGVQAAAFVLRHSELGTLAVQAAAADWMAIRMAVSWTDPHTAPAQARGIAQRAGVGSALGAATAILALTFGLITRSATFAGVTPSMTTLALGLAVAGLGAARDELILRGMVLRCVGVLQPAWAKVCVCAAAAAAARFGVDASASLSVAVDAGLGAALAAAWLCDRGAFMPWSANLSFHFAAGCVFRGGLIDVRARASTSDAVTTLCALAAIVAAVWVARRSRRFASGSY